MAIKFTSILRDLIVEGTRQEAFIQKYIKPAKGERKGKLPFQLMVAIIAADPTTRNPQGLEVEDITENEFNNIHIGKYSQWLINNFINPNVDFEGGDTDPNSPAAKQAIKQYQEQFMEDLYKVTGDLMKFERFKSRLPQEYRDINKLTPETLYDQVKDFSLEKTKATADEKKEASTSYQHPGAEEVKRFGNWTVVKISNTGQIGKDAACFYGGYYLEPQKGETRWCTSSPGLTWFDRYIKDGPLYVVIPNSPTKFTGSMEVGEKTGLPALRYQFHFPSNQFMDPADRQIDLVDFLSKQEDGLKEYFKPQFMMGLSQNNGEKVSVNYPGDSASKFIALYGFNEFFDTLPENIKRLEFTHKGGGQAFNLDLPERIGDFKQLSALHLVGCVSKIPDSICNLKELKFLSLPDNPNLQPLPACLAELPKLSIINIKNSKLDGTIPDALRQRAERDGNFFIFDQK
jgi:hypothetical protein